MIAVDVVVPVFVPSADVVPLLPLTVAGAGVAGEVGGAEEESPPLHADASAAATMRNPRRFIRTLLAHADSRRAEFSARLLPHFIP
jgi:hypothetical protein